MIRYLTLIFLFLIANCFAGDDGEKVLRLLQEKFQTINDLTVDIVQKSGGREVLSGNLSYKKENKFYLDLENNLIVSNGSTLWNYNKRQNKIIINEVDKTDPSFFSLNRIIYDYPAQCEVTLKKESESEVLVFIPDENSDLGFDEAKLWISKANLISKIMLNSKGSENVEVSFSNYTLNRDLPDSKFKIDPPEGSIVIDLR